MDMMAKKVPGLEVFIKWWDDRKKPHIQAHLEVQLSLE